MSKRDFKLCSDFFTRCRYCGYETRGKTAMRLHLKVSHNIDVDKKLLDLSKMEKSCDRFVCNICRECFYNKNSLEYHKVVSKHYS